MPSWLSNASNLWLVDNGQSLLARPEAARRVCVLFYRLRLILYAVPSIPRCDEMPVLGLAGRLQHLAERADVFQQALFARHAQVVDEGEMLRVFVQANASAVRNNRHVESATEYPIRTLSPVDFMGKRPHVLWTHFFAMSNTAMTSLTPPSLQASIWQ